MALSAGVMSVCIEYAKGLKDCDWFGRQDPYVIIRCGGQTFRTRTALDAGRNPVWNETFAFNCINENTLDIEVKDEDISPDDHIGTASVSFARAREYGSDRLQVPVLSSRSRKQHGFISVSLTWQPNSALRPQHQAAYAHPYASQPQPYYGSPQPAAPAYYAPPQPTPTYAAPHHQAPAYAPAPPPPYAAPPATHAYTSPPQTYAPPPPPAYAPSACAPAYSGYPTPAAPPYAPAAPPAPQYYPAVLQYDLNPSTPPPCPAPAPSPPPPASHYYPPPPAPYTPVAMPSYPPAHALGAMYQYRAVEAS